jgi:dihydroorotate dehydrogenase
MSLEQVAELGKVAIRMGVAGFVAANTSLSRDGLTHPNAAQAGGLSGAPLKKINIPVVKTLSELGLPVVGVGGIFSGADALDYLAAGADLIQTYTGFVYRGPALVDECLRALAAAS